MEAVFLKILNMSISAGWLVLAVVLLRLVLAKAPKAFRCILWGMVGLRLLCPISVESVLSLIPSAETLPEEFLYGAEPAIHSGIDSLNSAVNPILSEMLAPEPWASANPTQILSFLAAWVWIFGMIAMAVYALVSYLRLRHRVRISLHLQGRVELCDEIASPFILGLVRPRIYLPSAMDAEQREYVIAHEQAHLHRRDHWWKPLGFALLTVYWFNPLMWAAYILLCRDIELACDERVVRKMDSDDKKAYSEALLCCSLPRRSIAACPLAFGEVGVKARIKSVMNYKKPAFWLIVLAVVACVAAAVFFLTDPLPEKTLPEHESGSDLEGLSLVLKEADLADTSPSLTVDWVNRSGREVDFGEFYTLQYKDGGEWVDCNLLESRGFTTIGYWIRNNGSFEKTYSLSHFDLSEPGTYRLEASCSTEEEQHTVWLEFWLSKGLETQHYTPAALVYSNGRYSYVASAEDAPDYRFLNGFLWSFDRSAAEWKALGAMYQTQLDRKSFDGLFQNGEIWYESQSPAGLRRKNERAWRLFEGDALCYLLEQKDGTAYLVLGSETEVRWVYRLEREDTAVIGGADRPTTVTVR